MAKICINELSNYNNGELVYKWFDLDDYDCASEFWGAVNNWLKSCTNQHGQQCEEWILGDTDEIPEEFYSEYHFNAVAFFEYKALFDQVGEAKLEAYREVFGSFPESAEEVEQRLFATTDHVDDNSRSFHIEIGLALAEQNGLLNEVPKEVSRYFDYAKYGRDHYGCSMGLASGFVFWTE